MINYDSNLKIKEISEDAIKLFNLEKVDFLGQHYADQDMSSKLSLELQKEKEIGYDQDRRALSGESLTILDGHFYPKGFKALFSRKTPIYSQNINNKKIIGVNFTAIPIEIIYKLEILSIINAPQIITTEGVKSNFEEYFRLSYRKKAVNYNLSQREMDCLYLLAKGYSYTAIGKKIFLSSRTVEHYINSIKDKLGCLNKDEIIDKVYSENIVA